MLNQWKERARTLKRETYALYLAYRDARTPWYAKVFAGLVVAYALSPIDLIPDFIPVLGYLDDLVLVPLGITLAIRMIPRQVMDESREEAIRIMDEGLPINRAAVIVIVGIWITVAVLMIIWIRRLIKN